MLAAEPVTAGKDRLVSGTAASAGRAAKRPDTISRGRLRIVQGRFQAFACTPMQCKPPTLEVDSGNVRSMLNPAGQAIRKLPVREVSGIAGLRRTTYFASAAFGKNAELPVAPNCGLHATQRAAALGIRCSVIPAKAGIHGHHITPTLDTDRAIADWTPR